MTIALDLFLCGKNEIFMYDISYGNLYLPRIKNIQAKLEYLSHINSI